MTNDWDATEIPIVEMPIVTEARMFVHTEGDDQSKRLGLVRLEDVTGERRWFRMDSRTAAGMIEQCAVFIENVIDMTEKN